MSKNADFFRNLFFSWEWSRVKDVYLLWWCCWWIFFTWIVYVPGVNYVFVVVVCLVIICDRWTIYLLEIVADDLVNIWSCTYVIVYEPRNILMIDYSCLYLLIMIDVKLTPSGLWWTAYLFVWMGRRHAGLVDVIALWVSWG